MYIQCSITSDQTCTAMQGLMGYNVIVMRAMITPLQVITEIIIYVRKSIKCPVMRIFKATGLRLASLGRVLQCICLHVAYASNVQIGVNVAYTIILKIVTFLPLTSLLITLRARFRYERCFR